jgi:hypothetical protein
MLGGGILAAAIAAVVEVFFFLQLMVAQVSGLPTLSTVGSTVLIKMGLEQAT